MATAASATSTSAGATSTSAQSNDSLDLSGIDEALEQLQSQQQSDEASEQQTEKQLSQESQELKQASAGLDQLADEGAKALSTPAPEAPKQQKQSVFNNLIPMLVFSAFGGRSARANASAMLGGLTGMVQGFNAGDEQQYERAHQQYQDAYQRWLDHQNQMEKVYDLYRDAYKDRIDADEKAVESMLASLREHDTDRRMTLQVWSSLQASKARLISQHEQQQKTDAHSKVMEDLARQRLAAQLAAIKAKNGGDVNQIGSSAYNAYVDAIAHGTQPMPVISSYAMRDAATRDWAEHINADVRKVNPNFNTQTVQRAQRTRDAFATGKQGDSVRSFDVLVQHLDVLQNLIQALGSGDVRAFNAAAQEFQLQFGASAPTSFDAVRQFVGDEITKAVLGAQGALGDRDTAQAQLRRANSPQQLNDVLNKYRQLAGGQLNGLKRQYLGGINVGMPLPANQFEQDMDLSPDAIKLMSLADSAQRTATQAQVSAYAQKYGLTVDQAKQSIEAQGYTVQ